MEFWITLWKITLIGGIGAFAILAVWVSIGGYFDIKKMFKKINERHAEEEGE